MTHFLGSGSSRNIFTTFTMLQMCSSFQCIQYGVLDLNTIKLTAAPITIMAANTGKHVQSLWVFLLKIIIILTDLSCSNTVRHLVQLLRSLRRTVWNVGQHYFSLLGAADVVVYTICFIGIPSKRRLMFTDGPYSDL